MIIAVLLAAALAWWLHKKGVLLPNLRRLAIAGGAGLLIIRLLETGQIILAVTAAIAAGGWWYVTRHNKPVRVPAATDLADARATLGLAATADATAINAAWRRVIAQVHPDKGGTADLAARVTAARDLLLRG